MQKIKFNIPFIAGNEHDYVKDVMDRKHLAGKGFYTQQCKDWFKRKFGFEQCFITPSCTDALEMAALLLKLKPNDEVIVPSYTFVSTANAFAVHGANIVYADSMSNTPNVDVEDIKRKVTSRTKAIVVVHYGGFPVRVDVLREWCDEKGIKLIEDAACALGATIHNKPVGSFGHMATFSFHETKNITSGKGGMLVLNDPELFNRASIVWEKGTNRAAFFNGEVDKYGWVDFGSSFMNSDIQAAFLWGQLQQFDRVQTHRKKLWTLYHDTFNELKVPQGIEHNSHLFYLIMDTEEERQALIQYLNEAGIQAVFHYQALHNSAFSIKQFGNAQCPNADKFERCLVRLPLHMELDSEQVNKVILACTSWFIKQKRALVR